MRQKPGPRKSYGERVVKDIRRATGKQYSAEEKIRIVLDGLKGEDSLRNKTVVYRGQKMKAADAVSYHSSRISRLITFSNIRNVGSMAGEALPYVGIGVVVGVTAMEVNDACETLKEMHELDVAFNPDAQTSEDVTTVCSIEVPSKDELVRMARTAPSDTWETTKTLVPALSEAAIDSIDWSDYFDMMKVNSMWLVDETGATMKEFKRALIAAWGRLLVKPWFGTPEEDKTAADET